MAKKPSFTAVSALKFEPKPKKTRQGRSKNTDWSASSRNGKKKKYNRQGKG
jgi:hypothetical protein